jgi:hypothetical protein
MRAWAGPLPPAGDSDRLGRPRCVSGDSYGERNARGEDRAIFELARRQHGVVARSQLTQLGLTEDKIEYQLPDQH